MAPMREGATVTGKRRARPGTKYSGAGSGSGAPGGWWAPISGRTLPPTAVQGAEPMDIRVIVLSSPPSEGKSRRAVRLGCFPRPPIIVINRIIVCRSCSDRPKSCRQVPRRANPAAPMAWVRVTPPGWAHDAELHPLEESSPDPGNGEFFNLVSFCRTCR